MNKHTQPDPGPNAAETQLYREALHDLIDMGSDLARQLQEQAIFQAAPQARAKPLRLVTAATPAPPPDPDVLIEAAAAFSRIANAVCDGIVLAQSLDALKQPAKSPATRRAAARKYTPRALRSIVQRPADSLECDPPETLDADLLDPLEVFDYDTGSRPAAEIIARICRELSRAALPGTRPWKHRTPADIEQLVTRAAAGRDAGQSSAEPQGGHPTAIPRAHLGRINTGGNLPEHPAEKVAKVLNHPARFNGRRRTPPES